MSPPTIPGGIRSLARNAIWALALCASFSPVRLWVLGTLFLVQSVLPAGQALAFRGLIDAIVGQTGSPAPSIASVLPWLLAAFALAALEALARLWQTFTTSRLRDDLNLEVTSRILEHASKLDVGFFEDPDSQDALSHVREHAALHLARFVDQSLGAVSSLVQVLSLFAIVFVIEPLALIVLIPFALPYVWVRWVLSRTHYELELSRSSKRRWMQYFVSHLTQPSTVPEVRLLDLGPLLIRRFRGLMTELRDQDARLSRQSFRAAAIFSTSVTVALYALFLRVALRVLARQATLGDLAVFGAAATRLRGALESTINSGTTVLEEMLFVADLRKLLEAEPQMSNAAGPRAPATPSTAIAFENVSFTYPGSAEPALHDVSFEIESGETIALVGANGSGKTTLVKLAARFYDPTAGVVRLGGVDLRELDLGELHSRISFVFQDFGRYEGSVADNVAFGDWRRLEGDDRAVETIARRTRIHDLMAGLPEGYRTRVGRRFGSFDLSSGQWQQLAIARASAREAALLILDEPSSSLDPRAEAEILSRFRLMAEGRTTILVSHRLSTVRLADRVVVLDHGRIVEIGSHEELLRRGGAYASLFASSR